MIDQLSTVYNIPFLMSFLQNACKIIFLKNEQASSCWTSPNKLPNKYSISASKNIKSIGLISLPISIDIFPMREIDQSSSIQFITIPMR